MFVFPSLEAAVFVCLSGKLGCVGRVRSFHHPSSQGWAPRYHSHVFRVCIVLVWCIGSGFSFFFSCTTNLASLLFSCIYIMASYIIIQSCTYIKMHMHTYVYVATCYV